MHSRIKDTLLLVADTTNARATLRNIFQDSYNLLEAGSLSQAVLLLEQNSSCIALVLLDLPSVSAAEMAVLMTATHLGTDSEIPTAAFIEATAGLDREEHFFMLGAADVILKPYSTVTVQKRAQVLIDMYQHKWRLEKMVTEQSETIRNTNQVMMDALSAIIEHRSTESGNHVLRIRRFTKIMLEEVARCCPEYDLDDDIIDIIASASALHDIGKISVPDAILNKPGRLTEEEFAIMKTHTTVGSQLVQQLAGMGEDNFLRYAYNIALYHHERWGGKGYPCGLSGDEIPICAQVVGLTDAFDALTTKRVYKPAYPYQRAINMILNGECGEFSPKLLECFKHVRDQLVELASQYADGYSPKSDQISVPLPEPIWKKASRNSLQQTQAKYQSLLHYINDTVLELDLDNELYHVVYNPNPEFDNLLPHDSFNKIVETLQRSDLHPDDAGVVEEMHRFITEDFFRMNLRRHSFFFRLFNRATNTYHAYELVFLRVNNGSDQRLATVVWRRLGSSLPPQHPSLRTGLISSPALQGLVSNALRCYIDEEFTIDAGAAKLIHLIGYSEEEVADQFDNKLLNLIFPEDRAAFCNAITESIKTSGRTEMEFRMLRKNASPLWVLSKSRIFLEDDGQEYFYFAIRDNSKSKATHQQLQNDILRNQILIDQSGSIVFDWDMTSDTMYLSPKWEEHFGYKAVSENYSTQLGIATHFHPDDSIQVRSCIEQLKNGATTATRDIRIAAASGRYLWTKITATAIHDEDGTLTRIIGILQDIDELKRATLMLKEQAQQDSLTKLLNKVSTQTLISDYLTSRPDDALAGMLVLDLDNFKSVNDNYGHLYGDVVLTRTSAVLRKLFRTHDIIGRIGGDEFLILLKDIPSIELLQSRCDLLLDSLRVVFNELTPDLPVSCSIGAALAPLHGSTYGELFRHADEALYNAKGRGKNCYKIYNSKDKYAVTLDVSSRNTRIDSDDPSAVTSESFERFVFHSLYESKDLDATIQELLTLVGTTFNVSRAYIFENNEDNTACSNTFEWCNEGIAPEIENLQDVSYITDIPGWPDVYDESGIFYCTDITQLAPQFRAILEPQNIKSMLQFTIKDRGVFRGYVGFDECSSNRLWTKEQISQLEFLANVLSMFLFDRKKASVSIK